MSTNKIAFIGAGNMTQAIVTGLLKQRYPSDALLVANRSAEKLTHFPTQTSTDNIAMAKHADIIVLAVKPQQIAAVCQQLQALCQTTHPIIISVAAGVTTDTIAKQLHYAGPIIRAMPNTPAAIGLGATGLFANPQATAEQKTAADHIFAAVGITTWVESENLLNVVGAIAGSGPAYYFLMMEAMQAAGEKLGLSKATAATLISQTVIGAGELAKQENNQFAKLRAAVTSPKGSTLEAITTFQQGNFSQLVNDAIQAALQRSEAMATEN